MPICQSFGGDFRNRIPLCESGRDAAVFHLYDSTGGKCDVVTAFLAKHSEFVPQPVLPEWGGKWAESMVTLLPSDCNSDGFFLAKLQRVQEG